jgi:hypothetical protein
LVCDFGDKVKVLVELEDGQPSDLGCGSHDQIWDRRCPMPALIGKEHLDHYCPVFHRRVWYSAGMNDSGGGRSLPWSP